MRTSPRIDGPYPSPGGPRSAVPFKAAFRLVERMHPADPAAAEEFADALPDDPFHFTARCIVHRRVGRLWLRGPPSAPLAAVVVPEWQPTEPLAFGTESEEVWAILRDVPGWDCVEVSEALAGSLEPVLSRALRRSVRRYGDLYYALDAPPRATRHPAVRRLSDADLALIDRAPPALRPVGFHSTVAALTGGVVAGAVIDGALVGIAAMTTSSQTYADVGVHTLEPWRGRGLASAAATLVAEELLERGLTPVWSTGEDDHRSQRVAEKLGFRRVGRREYLVVPSLQSAGGFRPGPDG